MKNQIVRRGGEEFSEWENPQKNTENEFLNHFHAATLIAREHSLWQSELPILTHVPKSFPRNFIAKEEPRRFHPRVRVARFFKYWFPVILCMTLMFSASTNLGAPKNTSRIIGPVLRWLIPDISRETQDTIIFGIRKAAHVTEYALLSLLLWRARRSDVPMEQRRKWNWNHATFAILVAVAFAASDEFHQYFVSTRQGSIWDVLLDSSGAIAGILGLWGIGRWLKRW